MSEQLERALTALGAEVEWPETPSVVLRLDAAAPRARVWWRPVVVACAAAALAVAVAFAVPPARSAILDFFGLGGVTVERVSTLPAAEERPLAADLGAPITPEAAELVLGAPVVLPESRGRIRLYQRGGTVSAIFATPEPVLVSEFRPGFDASVVKKLAGMTSTVEWVPITDQVQGLWIAGDEHVVFWAETPPRLAGNVLVWERDGITYRLEGKTLTKERALELARDMLG